MVVDPDDPEAERIGDAPLQQAATTAAAVGIDRQALINRAAEAAGMGAAAYLAFWTSITADERKAIGKITHDEFKAVAGACDEERTIEARATEVAE